MVDAIKSGHPESAGPKVGGNRGKTPGSGRKKGTPNKATADLKSIAGQYTEKAIKELARLATRAKSEQARVAACKELLDRVYGRPAQAVTGEGGGPVKLAVEWLASAA